MNEQVMDLFRASGGILEGHFKLTSGLHSPMYLEKFRVLQYPQYTAELCGMIADRFRGADVQLVAGPTTGGVLLAYEVGRQLEVRGIFAERAEGGREFGRGFVIAPGERVLIVDDILTTGGSIRDVIDAVRRHEGDVVGVGVLADRSGGAVDFGVPLFACTDLHIPTYEPGDCPLCREGVPLIET
jgi:orotate phosphoribosyltransferase